MVDSSVRSIIPTMYYRIVPQYIPKRCGHCFHNAIQLLHSLT